MPEQARGWIAAARAGLLGMLVLAAGAVAAPPPAPTART